MSRPFLTTKYRGVGQTQCEVFQNLDGVLVNLFTYGTANVGLGANSTVRMGGLARHWRDSIYAVCPKSGIFKNTPPSTSGVLFHSFTSPGENCMNWQTVFKDGKMQLFTMYQTILGNPIEWRMVFIDEEDNISESSVVGGVFSYSRQLGLNVGNMIYSTCITSNSQCLQLTDPVSETTTELVFGTNNTRQLDIALHSGIVYSYECEGTSVVGEGNMLWNLSAATPKLEYEWEAFANNSFSFYPSSAGQNCIFSDGENLIMIGYPSGTTINEIAVYKTNFDANGSVIGVTDITDETLGFRAVPVYSLMRIYALRDIESEPGVIKTRINMGFFPPGTVNLDEGHPYHQYEWNGPSSPMTYKGVWGEMSNFDMPWDKIGGGARTFSNQDELNFTVTRIASAGQSLDVTYIIDGFAPTSGVAMLVKYNNEKDSPLLDASVSPITNGYASGNYIAGLSTGESGVFRWDISSNNITPGDTPNISAILLRTI